LGGTIGKDSRSEIRGVFGSFLAEIKRKRKRKRKRKKMIMNNKKRE
jgi:hypothetical protein